MSPSSPTLGGLVSEMHGAGALMRGWNVILSVREQALARAAQAHWTSQIAPAGAQPLAAQWHAGNGAAQKVVLDLAPLSVQIGDRPNALAVSLPVRSGSHTQGQLANGAPGAAGAPLARDAAVHWEAPQNLAADTAIEGSAPLRVVPTAPDTVSVVLDMAAGSFRLTGTAPQNLSQEHFGNGVAASFAAQQPHLPVLTMKLPSSGALAGLRTDTTRTATLPSSSSGSADGVLQTFFAKSQPPSDAPALGVSAPIPTGADYSMIVDSQTFVTELVTAFNGSGAGEPKLTAADPDGSTGIWYATIANPMQYQGTISYRNDGTANVTNHATMGMNFKGSPSGDMVLSTYITPDSNIQMGLTLAAEYSVETSGQTIRMQSGSSSVGAVGMVENLVKQQLQQFLGVDIADDMNAVDLQAPAQLLQGLQIPGHQVKLGQAKLPGDLVVVGTLEAQPS